MHWVGTISCVLHRPRLILTVAGAAAMLNVAREGKSQEREKESVRWTSWLLVKRKPTTFEPACTKDYGGVVDP